MIKELMIGLCFGALVFGLVACCASYPVVEYSWETQECVRVINVNGDIGSCERVPERFVHVWVG